jgi:hypothetical protein
MGLNCMMSKHVIDHILPSGYQIVLVVTYSSLSQKHPSSKRYTHCNASTQRCFDFQLRIVTIDAISLPVLPRNDLFRS